MSFHILLNYYNKNFFKNQISVRFLKFFLSQPYINIITKIFIKIKFLSVEHTGLEPVTSCVQDKRSPS